MRLCARIILRIIGDLAHNSTIPSGDLHCSVVAVTKLSLTLSYNGFVRQNLGCGNGRRDTAW